MFYILLRLIKKLLSILQFSSENKICAIKYANNLIQNLYEI